MPRTAEHIVACHKHATALRNAARPIWAHRIDLHRILKDAQGKTSAGEIAEVAHQLAAEIRRLPSRFFDMRHEDCDYDFLDAVEELESMTAQSILHECKEFGGEPADILDNWLSDIYEWCDNNRVWTRG